MKKILLALFVVCGMSFGQMVNERIDGVTNHLLFQNYSKASYTSSTANETTAFIPIKGQKIMTVWATVTDSIKAVLFYQLKNSFTGYTTAWAATADSISLIGTSSFLQSDRVHAFVTSDTTTSGYDLIRYYIDYVTWLGVAYTGGTLKIYTDIYKP